MELFHSFFPRVGKNPQAATLQAGVFTYTTDGTNVTITGYLGAGGAVGIPGIIDDKPVTTIGEDAFRYCTGLTNVTIPDSVTTIGFRAFAFGGGLMVGVYFEGNAPSLGSSVLIATQATGYYQPGAVGWGSTFAVRPAVLWNPIIQTGDESLGVQTNGFGFNIAESASGLVVVEACTNLTDGIWVPVDTNSMSSNSVYFSDPDWGNHASRFYRLSMP